MLSKRIPSLPLTPPPLAAGPRLACFHHAGGASSAFRSWLAQSELAGFAVCPVELPGRGGRFNETLAVDVRRLTEELWADLNSVWGDAHPIILFGHSMGALIAYETARRMEAAGRPPKALVVSARRSPTRSTPKPWRHLLDETELVGELRRLGGTVEDVFAHPELLELVLPVVRADFALTETYVPPSNPLVSCPVLAVRGEDDAEVSAEDVAAWRETAGAAFTLRTLPGDHFYLNKDASRRRLAVWIADLAA